MASFDTRDLNLYVSRILIVVLLGAALMMPVLIVFGGQINGDTARAEAERALNSAAAQRKTVDVQIVGPDETDVIIDPQATLKVRPQAQAAPSPSPAASPGAQR